LQDETSSWQDRFLRKVFTVDTGDAVYKTLHREQSNILKKLLDGCNVAVSAPTSFGKSFIIDAYITIKKPDNVMIIVPTIALMDEIRRRLCQKFSFYYSIITTSDSLLSALYLFVFPQERALGFSDRLESLDLLVCLMSSIKPAVISMINDLLLYKRPF
jgi:reverse gyrase